MLQSYRNSPWRAYLGLAIGILCLSFSAIFVRWADAPSLITSFYRMFIAVVALSPLFFQRLQRRKTLPRIGLWFAILGGLFFAADLALWTEGVRLAGATNPTLLSNTAPLWVGLGATLLFKEPQKRAFWIGLGIAMSGAIIILGLDNLKGFELGLGSFLGLLSGVFYGAYYLAAQRGRETLGPLTYFWPAAASSSLVLFIIAAGLKLPFWNFSTQTWLSFLGLGLITQVVGYLAINDALGSLPASIVAPTMLGQPVLTGLLAIPLLGEILTFWQILGGLFVLAGVFLVHRSRSKTPK